MNFRLIVLLIALISVIPIANADSKKFVLLTAKAIKSERLKENSRVTSNGDFIWAPDTYKFKFNDVKVKQGDTSDFPSEMEFNLNVRNDEAVLNAERIYLLLDISTETPVLMDWGFVSSFVCIPEKLVDPRYADSYFNLTEESKENDEKCTYIRSHYEAPPSDGEL